MNPVAAGVLVGVVAFGMLAWSTSGNVALLVGLLAGLVVWQLQELRLRVRTLEKRAGSPDAHEPSRVDGGHPASAGPVATASADPLAPRPSTASAANSAAGPTARPASASQSGGRSFAPERTREWTLPALGDLETLIAGRGLAIVGGLALTIGILFFLGLAFSRGWIGPEARVAIGLLAGAATYVLGSVLLLRAPEGARERAVVAHVIVAVGLFAISLSLFAATRLYGFIPAELGVGIALAVAGAAAWLAVRSDSQVVAGFGLVAVLAAPPLMGAPPTVLTIAFLGAAMLGTTAIALFRSWRWLPPAAFLLAAPQLGVYIAAADSLAIPLVALVTFWALNAFAAAGEELRVVRTRLAGSSATLLVANAAFLVWGGFELLDGTFEPLRGAFLLGVAVTHLLLALRFLVGDDRHPFGILAAGSGIAALTLAAPVQLGAPVVPMAWAAEAVALTWLYVERRNAYSGMAATALGLMAALHILAVEYPLLVSQARVATGLPFVNADGAALAFVLCAAAVAAWLVRDRPSRVAIAAAAGALLVVSAPFELHGAALVGLLTVVAAGALAVQRQLVGVPLTTVRADDTTTSAFAGRGLYGTGLLAAAYLLVFLLTDEIPLPSFVAGLEAWAPIPSAPFLNEPTLAAGIVVAGALTVAMTVRDAAWRASAVLVAAGVVAYLVPSQAGPAVTVAVWSLLAVALHVSSARWAPGLRFAPHAFIGVAVLETIFVVAAPDRLVVRGVPFPEPPVFNGGTLAVAAVTVALALRNRLTPRGRDAVAAAALAAVFAVHLVSVATIDLFQMRLGGSTPLEELQKQGQVALSVLWAVIGVSTFAIGVARRWMPPRLFGLSLIGIVTLKVFILDLAALDVAYRVLSFVALGVLLLGAAYFYARLQAAPRSGGR